MNDPFSIDLEDPHLASLLEAERMNHGVWRRASSEPLEFDSAETGKRTEAPPLTRYFVRQLERLGAGIIDASEGERPSWRFIIRIQASFEIAARSLRPRASKLSCEVPTRPHGISNSGVPLTRNQRVIAASRCTRRCGRKSWARSALPI